MDTVNVRISQLKPAEYNPRVMPDAEMEKLKRSVSEFGFVEPVVANRFPGREGVIVGGHQRVEAARLLGLEEVPVVWVELNPARERLLNLALNRISGSWDEGKLADVLAGLNGEVADLILSGFDDAEIDDLLRERREEGEKPFDVDKAVKEVGASPQSRPGEVYELGRHRLACGDSTDPAVTAALMGGAKADMAFTDPPYNVGYRSSGQNGDRWAKAYGDRDCANDAELEEFCAKAFGAMRAHLKPGGAFYVCSGWASWAAFWRALLSVGLRPRGCIVWDKGHGGMGWSDYWYQHELVAAGLNGHEEIPDEPGEEHGLIAYGFDGRAKRYFARRKRMTDVWRVAREPAQSYVHPTQKPVKLVENAIYNSTRAGGSVLDLFAGSGSTLAAAERTGRTAYLVERSPLFCDVIRKRYEQEKTSK